MTDLERAMTRMKEAQFREINKELAAERVADAKRTARNLARRERDQVRRDCGLTRGRDSLGRVIWE